MKPPAFGCPLQAFQDRCTASPEDLALNRTRAFETKALEAWESESQQCWVECNDGRRVALEPGQGFEAGTDLRKELAGLLGAGGHVDVAAGQRGECGAVCEALPELYMGRAHWQGRQVEGLQAGVIGQKQAKLDPALLDDRRAGDFIACD